MLKKLRGPQNTETTHTWLSSLRTHSRMHMAVTECTHNHTRSFVHIEISHENLKHLKVFCTYEMIHTVTEQRHVNALSL